MNNKLIRCLFGYHKYTVPSTRYHAEVYICEKCKKFGRFQDFGGFGKFEIWYEFDKKGNIIHSKDSGGYQVWWEYNKLGYIIYRRDSKGNKQWYGSTITGRDQTSE